MALTTPQGESRLSLSSYREERVLGTGTGETVLADAMSHPTVCQDQLHKGPALQASGSVQKRTPCLGKGHR